LTIWQKPGTELPDLYGRSIEQGKYDRVIDSFLADTDGQNGISNPGGAVDLYTGASSYLPGARVSNYHLMAPHNLIIHEKSMTVGGSILLSDLLPELQGTANQIRHLHWAACTR
jgi:hypothetical protein